MYVMKVGRKRQVSIGDKPASKVQMYVHAFFGCCLATKVFRGSYCKAEVVYRIGHRVPRVGRSTTKIVA